MAAKMECQLDKIPFDDYFTLQFVIINSVTHVFYSSIEQKGCVTVRCSNASIFLILSSGWLKLTPFKLSQTRNLNQQSSTVGDGYLAFAIENSTGWFTHLEISRIQPVTYLCPKDQQKGFGP